MSRPPHWPRASRRRSVRRPRSPGPSLLHWRWISSRCRTLPRPARPWREAGVPGDRASAAKLA